MTDETPPAKYRGGCVPGMRRGRPGVPGCHAACLHRATVEEYRDTRHAWEQRRESDLDVGHLVAGGAGATVAPHQLSDEEYAAAFPPPTFKDWLIAHAR